MTASLLFLIDGNSVLYRSYYAIRQLSNSAGFPTNAIYGFINTLNKIIEEEKPQYLGVVFDTGRPTIRHQAYKEYKAGRKPMPEDLTVQVPVLKQVLQALRIPVFEYENYEADDVLATLARQAAEHKQPAVVVTSDKDLLQIIGPWVAIFNPAKEIYIIDSDIAPDFLAERRGKKLISVEDYFGVKAEEVGDLLALWGDASDGIPGVPGIGEKTARNLIQQYGHLGSLLEHLDEIKNPRIRDSLKNNLEALKLSRELVRVEDKLPLELDLGQLRLSEPDYDLLLKLYRQLDFTTLIPRYLKNAEPGQKKFITVLTEEQFKNLLELLRQTELLALDTETTSLSPTRARLVGLSLAVRTGEAYYLPSGIVIPAPLISCRLITSCRT